MKRQRTIKALAFDLDGTLVDSLPGLAQALRLTFAHLNLPSVTDEQVKTWVGNGVDVLITRGLQAVNAEVSDLEKARPLFDTFYQQTIQSGTICYPHVKDTLIQLKQLGYPLAIVTNKPHQFIPAVLASLELTSYFSLVLGGGSLSQQKPHPAPLFQVLATFGLYAEELLFVGDSRNDILAAQQAHCPVVGMTYGYNYGESIALSQPDFVCEQFSDILSLLNQNSVSKKG